MTSKIELNGTFKWIINHILIIGSIVSGIILIGRWIENTKGSITNLEKTATKIEQKIEPQVIEHEVKIKLLENNVGYIRDNVERTDKNVQKLLEKVK